MSAFFEGIAQEPITFHGYAGKAPMFFREVRMMGGVFTCNLAAAKALMPTSSHHPHRIWNGRGVAAIHCFEYLDTDIGPYNEVSLSIAIVHGTRGGLSWAALARAEAKGRYQAFVADLPVTTDAAVHGGIDILGFPKWLARIEFTEDEARRVCTVRDAESGAVILSVAGDRIPTRPAEKVISLESYPRKDGATLHATMRVNLIEWGNVAFARRMKVETTDHPRAAMLRGLSLGKQVGYLYAPRCEAILMRPEVE